MTKILIIEDEELIARMYQKALAYQNFNVKTAIGGKAGLEIIKDFKPDLVLLDIMMPEMDGIEVLFKIKNDPQTKHTPVVLLTNLSGTYDEKFGLTNGANAYWIKTEVKPSEMGAKINQLLNEHRQ